MKRNILALIHAFLLATVSIYAQSSLPVRDFSVGSVYQYRVGNQTLTESVLSDTIIRGKRYGVLQTPVGTKYVRANDTAIYEFQRSLSTEAMIFRYGQSCLSNQNVWFITDSLCNFISNISENRIQYSNSVGVFNVGGLTINNGTFAHFEKPLGVVKVFWEQCVPMYFPGHITRPPQYSGEGWTKTCQSGQVAELVSAKLAQKLPVKLSLKSTTADNTVQLGNIATVKFSLPITSFQSQVLGFAPEITYQFTIDTSGIEDVKFYSATSSIPIQPERTIFTTTNATFRVKIPTNTPSELGYFTFVSKSLKPRSNVVEAQALDNFVNFIVTPGESQVNQFGIRTVNVAVLSDSNKTVVASLNKQVRLGVNLMVADKQDLLPERLSNFEFEIATDVTKLDSLKIYSSNKEELKPFDIGVTKNILTQKFRLASINLLPQSRRDVGGLCDISFISQSQISRKNVISIRVLSVRQGYSFAGDTVILKQEGNSNLKSPPNMGKSGDVLISMFPNPANQEMNLIYSLQHESSNTNLCIYDTNGFLVKFIDVGLSNSGWNEHLVDIADLTSGGYFLKIITDKGMLVSKFIKWK